MAHSDWQRQDPVIRTARVVGLSLAVGLAVFVFGEALDWSVPEPLMEALPGCGPGWERRWDAVVVGTLAEEVRRCLGVPDVRTLETFDSVAVAKDLQALRSGLYMGPGPAEAFMLGLLPHGAQYEVWGWNRSEKINMRYYDRVDVSCTVYVVAAGCAEECVIEKRRNVPIWESFRVY